MPGESKKNSSKKRSSSKKSTRRVRRLTPIPSVQRKAFLKELEKKIVKNKITYEEMVTINGCFNNCIRKKNVGDLEVIPDISQRPSSMSVTDNILRLYTGNANRWSPDINSNNMPYSLLAKNQQQEQISRAFDPNDPNSDINRVKIEHIMSQYSKGKKKSKKSRKKGKKGKNGKKGKKGGRRVRRTRKKGKKGGRRVRKTRKKSRK